MLNDKSTYSQLELPSGRMAQVKKGDVVAGALGHRHALFGYSGHLPTQLAPGDTVHLLNIGGVLGICDSVNPDLGPPFECEVLGAVLHFPYLGERIGVAGAHRQRDARPRGATLDADGVPVVALVGSCMNCGKTAAACALVRHLATAASPWTASRRPASRCGGTCSPWRTPGRATTGLFTDLGIVSTTRGERPGGDPHPGDPARRRAGRTPSWPSSGDGLLGAYGVAAILDDAEIRAAFTAVVLAANDPVAAWGGVRMLRERFGIEPVAVTGPATDNLAGTRIIEEAVGVPAINARTDGERLAALVARSWACGVPRPAAVAG